MGQWTVVGLAQPGAGLADAVAAWMKGPPLTDCWRVEQCVPGRPKPPLCLVVSPVVFLSIVLPLACFLSVSSSPSSSSFSLYPLPLQFTAAPLPHKSTYTHSKNMLADTRKKYVHTKRTWSTKNISFKCSKCSKWLKQISPYLLTVVLPLVIKSQ